MFIEPLPWARALQDVGELQVNKKESFPSKNCLAGERREHHYLSSDAESTIISVF